MGDPPGDASLYPEGQPTGVITADCIKFRVSHLLPDPSFFVYAIRSNLVRSQIAGITMGVAQTKMSLERFKGIALPVPPAAEQQEITRRVTALLTSADAVEQRIVAA